MAWFESALNGWLNQLAGFKEEERRNYWKENERKIGLLKIHWAMHDDLRGEDLHISESWFDWIEAFYSVFYLQLKKLRHSNLKKNLYPSYFIAESLLQKIIRKYSFSKVGIFCSHFSSIWRVSPEIIKCSS